MSARQTVIVDTPLRKAVISVHERDLPLAFFALGVGFGAGEFVGIDDQGRPSGGTEKRH